MRQPEGGARRHLVPEEELLVLADLAMISLGRLLQKLLVLGEGCLVGEGDAGNSLNRLVFAVAEPVRGGILNRVSMLGPL